MKKIVQLVVFSFVVLLFASCEDVIQVKLDEGSKLYVIDAFINNRNASQIVKVTTNDSYFSNKKAPAVTNASVVLVDLTGNITYNFPHTGDGNYVYSPAPGDSIHGFNHNYMLKVLIDGYEYTSTSVQKRASIIDSIATIYNDGTDPFGGPKDTYNCLLFARDKADNVADYYWIRTFRNDTLFNEPSDLNINIDGTGGVVTNAGVDTIDFTPPSTFLGFETFRKNDKCSVEVHSINRDTYFFFVQAIAQINNGGLFATTPENVKTNISTPDGAKTKAIGWFSMSSVASMKKLVQ